jgi:hypothetical protein
MTTFRTKLVALGLTGALLLAGGAVAVAKPDHAGTKGKSGSAHDATNPQGKTKGWAKNNGKGKSDSAHSNLNPEGKLRGWDPAHPHDDETGEDETGEDD